MKKAEPTDQPAAALEPVPAGLRGRVDALDGGRLFGWAWYPAQPDSRLEVKIFAADKLLAVASADRPRVDLRRNGVGDGGHAFDVELPEVAVKSGRRLRVIATHPEGGADLELQVPSVEERAAEAALAASFGPMLDRLEAATLHQQRIQKVHASAVRQLAGASRQLSDVAAADSALAQAVQSIREGQQRIADRFAELDVFLMRFDGVIGEFNLRLDGLAKQSAHGVKGHLLLLSAAAGFIVGIGIAAAAGL